MIEQKIDQQEPTKGSMGLGVHLAPDSNNKDQIKYMTGKVLKWTKNIKAAFLSQFAAVLDIKTTIWATLRYPLAALTMTESQCDKLVQPIYSCILPQMGVNRHIAKLYRYEPKGFHSLGLPNLYTDQGIEQLKQVLFHGGSDTQCGILLQCCLKYHQLEVGSAIPLFMLDYDKYGLLCTDSYIKSIWQFFHKNKSNCTQKTLHQNQQE